MGGRTAPTPASATRAGPGPSARSSERGNVVGAVVFGLVLACVMIGGYLWLEGRAASPDPGTMRPYTNGGGADRWTRLLGAFLSKGPAGGTWETRYLSCTYIHVLAPHPEEPETFLIAQVEGDGTKKPRAVSRWLVPRQFLRSPPSLFFSNYARSQGPGRETLQDGTKTWRVHWAPRRDPEGLTERRVWFAEGSGEVVQISDHSRTGHLIRGVRRLSKGTGDWDPARVVHDSLERFDRAPPDPGADPERALSRVAAEAPFPIYTPEYVPAGFVLVRASYTAFEAPADPDAEDDGAEAEKTTIHLVSQLYSDGLALISVAVAPPSDMDTIELINASMEGEDPSACPGLPDNPESIRQEGSIIRMRADTCRTVLRRDDLPGVSVTLIGRNELPAEEYLRMIGNFEAVPAPGARDDGK